MTTEEFTEVWNDKQLRAYIVCQARRRSKRQELQEEFIQEAWLCISCAPADMTTDSYKELALKAIYSGYWQEYKHRLMTNHPIMAKAQRRIVWDKRIDRYVEVIQDEY